MTTENLRKLTAGEISQLTAQGCKAERWDMIYVADKFDVTGIHNCRFKGCVEIGERVSIENIGCSLSDCRVEDGAVIENVGLIECSGASRFGGGTEVRAVNEGGGREVVLFEGLTAQIAYVMAMYRHRTTTLERLTEMIENELKSSQSSMCVIGEEAMVRNCGVLRDVRIGAHAKVEGASWLENGTMVSSAEEPARVGADAKMYDFIMLGGAQVTDGAVLRRCFVGQNVKIGALSGTDTLFFANSHFENGETCSVFAGPYSVSHHKSSLLIAGMFSFFNAGSATNMSNHLFKTGPVHQGIHQRGCKFASGAYIMQPCKVGAFSVVLGHHKSHPDTESLPFSYLIDNGGSTWLLPAHNLTTYGTVRDMAKWPARDGRKGPKRDLITFEEANPFICQRVAEGENILEELTRKSGDATTCTYKRMSIKTSMARRGMSLYATAKSHYMGRMLEYDGAMSGNGAGRWIDAGGLLMPLSVMNGVLDEVDCGTITTTEQLESRFREAHADYAAMARCWAVELLSEELGHTPSREEIKSAIEHGRKCGEQLHKAAERDKESDYDEKSMIGYGIDSIDAEEQKADFAQVRWIQTHS